MIYRCVNKVFLLYRTHNYSATLSDLQAKEVELSQSKEQFLSEKLVCDKATGELKALRSRLAEATELIFRI